MRFLSNDFLETHVGNTDAFHEDIHRRFREDISSLHTSPDNVLT
jgi:hypothetical protein